MKSSTVATVWVCCVLFAVQLSMAANVTTSNTTTCNGTHVGNSTRNATSNSTNTSQCGNSTSNASTTTTPPPTTTRAPPTTTPAPTTTLAPPQTLSPCDSKKFYCNDTLWRCVRGAPVAADGTDIVRCSCLATYWNCLVKTSCGTTPDETQLCAARASALQCGDTDSITGLAVCPANANVVYDESGGGWIAALVFFLMALVAFLVTLAYVSAARGWIRRPNGQLWFTSTPPIEQMVIDKLRQRQRAAQEREGVPPTFAKAKDAEPEAPDIITLSPEGIERYRDYLRVKYREARERGDIDSDDSDPPFVRPQPVHPQATTDGLPQPPPVDPALVRHAALASFHGASRVDEPGRAAKVLPPDAALDDDMATRDVLNARQRMIDELERERALMVREYSVGRATSRDGLPSEMIVTTDGIQQRRAVQRGTDDDVGYDYAPPRRTFAEAGYLFDRHGGFNTAASPSRDRDVGMDMQAAAVPSSRAPPSATTVDRSNPISVLFHNLDLLDQQQSPRRRPVESTRVMHHDEEFPGVPPWAAAARPLDSSPAPAFSWMGTDAPFATPIPRAQYDPSSVHPSAFTRTVTRHERQRTNTGFDLL